MNYDTVEFCKECRRPKPKAGFRFVDHKHFRKCCEDCYERNRKAKEEHRKKQSA